MGLHQNTRRVPSPEPAERSNAAGKADGAFGHEDRNNHIRGRCATWYEIEFFAWLGQAVPGERPEYHRGFPALDIFPMFGRLPDKDHTELRRLGARAFWAAELGLVHLVQERRGPDQFAYVAIARPRKAAAASLLESDVMLASCLAITRDFLDGHSCSGAGRSWSLKR